MLIFGTAYHYIKLILRKNGFMTGNPIPADTRQGQLQISSTTIQIADKL